MLCPSSFWLYLRRSLQAVQASHDNRSCIDRSLYQSGYRIRRALLFLFLSCKWRVHCFYIAKLHCVTVELIIESMKASLFVVCISCRYIMWTHGGKEMHCIVGRFNYTFLWYWNHIEMYKTQNLNSRAEMFPGLFRTGGGIKKLYLYVWNVHKYI